jgi:sugar phosphate permease
MGLAFSAMTNLIVDAVPSTHTGVATGMNANIRTVGGAIGSQVVTSVITAGVATGAVPKEHGYVLSFLVLSAGMIAAAVAALLVPNMHRRVGVPAAETAEPLAERV